MQKKMECKAGGADETAAANKTHQRRVKNNEARALCDSVHGASLPLRGDGKGLLDGEDFIKPPNAAIRFLCAPYLCAP